MNSLLKPCYKAMGKVAGFLWKKGWAEKNAGNISINVSDLLSLEEVKGYDKSVFFELEKHTPALAGKVLIITASGSRMRDVKKNPRRETCLIEINHTGRRYRILSTGEGGTEVQPTSEMPAHLVIHDFLVRNQRQERVVLHAHVTEAIMLTHHPEFKKEESINNLLWRMQPETSLFIPEGVGFVSYKKPGSYEIAQSTAEKLLNHKAVIWEKHGCVVIDEDLEDAFDLMDIIGKTIRMYLECRKAGFEPEGLTNEQLNQMRNKL